MEELKLIVPTYNANYFSEEVERGEKPEFGDPHVPIVIREAGGVRIVLGTHDYDDCDKPDVQIERQPNGWAIFLHPLGGSDACGYVYFLDDGRSFLCKEYPYGPTPEIEVREHRDEDEIPEIRRPFKQKRADEDVGIHGNYHTIPDRRGQQNEQEQSCDDIAFIANASN